MSFKFNIDQRVLRAKVYSRTKEHQVGHIVGIVAKDLTFSPTDLYMFKPEGGEIVLVYEFELVRILDWNCVTCPQGCDPFNPREWMDKETTHWFNSENNWLLIRKPEQDFRTSEYFMYLTPHESEPTRIVMNRRMPDSPYNQEGWI